MTLSREANRERMRRVRAADRPVAVPDGELGPLSAAVREALALLPTGLVAERTVECAAALRLAERLDGDPSSPRVHLLTRELIGVVADLRRVSYAYCDVDDPAASR